MNEPSIFQAYRDLMAAHVELAEKTKRLEKEANWLAKFGQGEQNCPYLALGWGDGRAEWCCCNDTDEDDYFECDEDPVECWLKAARKAVEAES